MRRETELSRVGRLRVDDADAEARRVLGRHQMIVAIGQHDDIERVDAGRLGYEATRRDVDRLHRPELAAVGADNAVHDVRALLAPARIGRGVARILLAAEKMRDRKQDAHQGKKRRGVSGSERSMH
jgi:hypothetical protein